MVKNILLDKEGITLTAEVDTGVHTLRLGRGPNVINPGMVHLLDQAISKIEAAPHPKALVVTGTGKFFSNGLDLKFLQSSNDDEKAKMIVSFWEFLARLLVLDCRTVAAINGHVSEMRETLIVIDFLDLDPVSFLPKPD